MCPFHDLKIILGGHFISTNDLQYCDMEAFSLFSIYFTAHSPIQENRT